MSDLNPPRESRGTTRLKAIDAICDQFEAHWHAHQALPLEHYVRQVNVSDRPELLYELLHLQFRWQPPADWAQARDLCVARFPQFSAEIDRAFGELAPAESEPSGLSTAVDSALIRQVQSMLGSGGSREKLATDKTEIEVNPTDNLATEIAQLWSLILRHATSLVVIGETDLPAAAVAVANELLEIFPARRQQILRSVLVGMSLPAIVKDFGTAPSTVSQTILAAIEVLQRATGG